MKRVFLSSTVLGLERHRAAVANAIDSLEGYCCVCMERFGSRPDPPIDVCLDQLRSCDVYVGLIGHTYGSCPPGAGMSYTELEYDAAISSGKTVLMFLASEDLRVRVVDIEPDALRSKQLMFRDRINAERTRTVFESEHELSALVVRAIHNSADRRHPTCGTTLLFQFVTARHGWDTNVAISNTSSRPWEPNGKAGRCRVFYYGTSVGSGLLPTMEESEEVLSGESVGLVLSGGGSHGLRGGPGFQGYLIALCDFPDARGIAVLTGDSLGRPISTSYIAEILPQVDYDDSEISRAIRENVYVRKIADR